MEKLTQLLKENCDPSYREFFLPLIPGIDPDTVIGVRTPVLRSLAKEYRGSETAAHFMQSLPHCYYEEVNLHIFLLSYEKDYAAYIRKLKQILPEVKCWASCDVIRNPILKKHTDELYEQIRIWITDSHVYTVRLAVGFLMAYFLGSAYRPEHLHLAVSAQGDEYYINMMIAWYLATAMIAHEKDVLPLLENRVLNPEVHRMTIRKACESFRIPAETKKYLKSLR